MTDADPSRREGDRGIGARRQPSCTRPMFDDLDAVHLIEPQRLRRQPLRRRAALRDWRARLRVVADVLRQVETA